MTKHHPTPIPPVFAIGTGRCGSTAVSNILNLHPRMLSLSEFIAYTGMRAFRPRRTSGDRIWEILARQQPRTRVMLAGDYPELLYPFGDPGARYTREDVPPILCATLPHLTGRHDALFDEIEPVIRGQPRQPVADHYRALFAWLCRRLGRDVWVERSGASLMFASRLLREFPEARAVHVHRDGREAAISMSRHYLFRLIAANLAAFRSIGFDAVGALARSRHWDTIAMNIAPAARLLPGARRFSHYEPSLAEYGALWSAMIERGERIFRTLPADRLLHLPFEDLQADPEPQLRRLVRFIDPSLEDERWLRKAAAIPRPTPSEFARLAPADREALQDACRPGLERLGYPLAAPSDPRSPSA